jgi:hypothetical protein
MHFALAVQMRSLVVGGLRKPRICEAFVDAGVAASLHRAIRILRPVAP